MNFCTSLLCDQLGQHVEKSHEPLRCVPSSLMHEPNSDKSKPHPPNLARPQPHSQTRHKKAKRVVVAQNFSMHQPKMPRIRQRILPAGTCSMTISNSAMMVCNCCGFWVLFTTLTCKITQSFKCSRPYQISDRTTTHFGRDFFIRTVATSSKRLHTVRHKLAQFVWFHVPQRLVDVAPSKQCNVLALIRES
jgi:hypothetical protein